MSILEGFMRRSLVIAIIATVGLAGCVPPEPPPAVPELPAGVGVSLLRDVGGTNDPDLGTYTPSFVRETILDGVTSDPMPVGPGSYYPSWLDSYQTPDGTAKYPWNGFAGEGITFSSIPSGDDQTYVLTSPAGTCGIGRATNEISIRWITPSPDGTKVVSVVSDGYSQTIEIRSLVDGGVCPLIVSELLVNIEGDGDHVQGPFVWRPESNQIAYARSTLAGGEGSWFIDRLAASASATPETVFDSGADIPYLLGWSIGNRLLMWGGRSNGDGTGTAELFTMPSGGGEQRVLDSVTFPGHYGEALNLGYFVPGTTNVVLCSSIGTVTYGSEGYTYPLLAPWIKTDSYQMPGSQLAPAGPGGTHLIPVGSDYPPTLTPAPNSMLIEGFIH